MVLIHVTDVVTYILEKIVFLKIKNVTVVKFRHKSSHCRTKVRMSNVESYKMLSTESKNQLPNKEICVRKRKRSKY